MFKTNILLLSLAFLLAACSNNSNNQNASDKKVEIKKSKNYELHKINSSKHTLVLYPGGGTTSKQTKEEFEILEIAEANDISVLLMNFNRHLWIDAKQTKQLSDELKSIFEKHELVNQSVFIGGMSIGGNISLTLANDLCMNSSSLCPKGVFIIDSPIDLFELYKSSIYDINNPAHSEERLTEPKWIVNYFEENFGREESLLENISKVSPFTMELDRINVPELKKCKLRLYTEPDEEWWLENRQTKFENTNAYFIQTISKHLEKENWTNIELIETKNKGFRANGNRHPHSWSIVDTNDLVNWMKEK